MEKDVTFIEIEPAVVRVFFNSPEAKEFVMNEVDFASHVTRQAGEIFLTIESFSKDSMIKVLQDNELTFETV